MWIAPLFPLEPKLCFFLQIHNRLRMKYVNSGIWGKGGKYGIVGRFKRWEKGEEEGDQGGSKTKGTS